MKTVTTLHKKEEWANAQTEQKTHQDLAETEMPDENGRIYVQTTVRTIKTLPGDTVEINPPIPKKTEINWLSTLLPAFTTISISVVMSVVMGNVRMMIYTLPMTLVGLLLTFVNYGKSKKEFIKTQEAAEQYFETTEDKLRNLQNKQRRFLQDNNPKPQDCMETVSARRMQSLWVRKSDDSDFGCAKIGRGTVPGSYTIKISNPGSAHEQNVQQKKAVELKKKYSEVPQTPVICNFFQPSVLGISGSRASTDKLIQNILIQLTTSHCYTDVQVVLLGKEAHSAAFSWTKYLPHTQGGGLVSFEEETRGTLLQNFSYHLKERVSRMQSNKGYGSNPMFLPRYLVILLEPALLQEDQTLDKYLYRDGIGVGVIAVSERGDQLIPQCQQIIDLDGDDGVIYHKNHSDHKQTFHMDSVKNFDFLKFGKLMQPLAVKQNGTEEEIPKKYTFYQLLGISCADQLNLKRRWEASNVLDNMRAPIGISGKNKTLYLDVHYKDEADGPHGLVAGNTGSGKSELLISYLLAMAVNFSPVDVNFFLIDYKSALPNQLGVLPHTVGFVRDIDNESLNRYLLSLESELDRRERIFDQVLKEEKYIGYYISLYKSGKVSEALPHLIILVDEFKALKENQPEFIKKLVDIAIRGRSLGFHLILAAQLISSILDEQIDGNSKFRICLKQINEQESRALLKSDAATCIKNAGRGYLRVGQNEIIPFQSGYSGCDDPTRPGQTQRAVIIDEICQYCESADIEKRPNLYLPALTKKMPYVYSTPQNHNGENLCAAIGRYDAPDQQRQPLVDLDLSGKNTLIIGSAGNGKTNLLQTMIRSLAERYTPEDVNLYILDCNSMFLRNYDGLPHVGGVALASDSEKVGNLFRMLLEEIETRKDKISKSGLSSFNSYLEADYRDFPHIVLMIDNYLVLKNRYLSDHDPLLRIMIDGPSWGISVVMTNAQESGIPHNYNPVINHKIALFCSDETQYHNMFGYTKMSIPEIAGRFMITVGKRLREGQSYLAFEGEREIDRYNQVRQFVSDAVKKHPNAEVKPIPAVPEKVTFRHVYGKNALDCSRCLALGMDYGTVAPMGMNLESQFMLAVIAQNQGQKKLVLDAFLKDVIHCYSSRPVQLLFLDSMKKEFRELEDMPYVSGYYYKVEDICEIMENISEELVRRGENPDDTVSEPLLLVVINNRRALDTLSESKTHMKLFDDLSKNYRELGVLFLFADVPDDDVKYSSPEILKRIKAEQKGLVFDIPKNWKFFDSTSQQQKTYSIALGETDAYYLNKDTIHRIKLIEE